MDNKISKPWRINTKTEFYEKANRLLDGIINDLFNRLGDSKSKEVNIANEKAYYTGIHNIDYIMKEHGSHSDETIKEKIKLASMNMHDWVLYSLKPKSFEDIILRSTIDSMYNSCIICELYTSTNLPESITEEQMDDWIYVTTSLFRLEYWNDEMVELVVNHIINFNEEPLETNINSGVKDLTHPITETDFLGNPVHDRHGNPIIKYPELPAVYKVTSKDKKLYNKLKEYNYPESSFRSTIRDKLDWKFMSNFVAERFPKYEPIFSRYSSKSMDARGNGLD